MNYDDVLYWDRIDGVDGDVSRLDVAADKNVCDYVRHCSRPFIFSASMTPSSCAAASAALKVLEENPGLPERLAELSDYLRNGLKERGVKVRESSVTPIVPIYTYTLMKTLICDKALFENGVYVNPVLSPAVPEGECLLRLSLMATHTKPLIDEAMNIGIIVKNFYRHFKILF